MLVDDLFRVLDALKVERCVLAGESAGGLTVLQAARRTPERFNGLVLVGARYQGALSEGGKRLVAGCKVDFPTTMQAFVNAYRNHHRHKPTGLYYWQTDRGIGVDNDPSTFGRPPGSSASIYLNCLMYRELLAMAYLAERLNLGEIAELYRKDAIALKTACQSTVATLSPASDHRTRTSPRLSALASTALRKRLISSWSS